MIAFITEATPSGLIVTKVSQKCSHLDGTTVRSRSHYIATMHRVPQTTAPTMPTAR